MLETSERVTLQLNDADSHRVAAELRRVTGAEVMFTSRRPDATVNLNFKDQPLWDVLDALSSEGSIRIAREDFGHLKSVRQSFLTGERIAVCFGNVTAKRLAADLSFLTGREVYVTAGDPRTLINYKGQAVTFEEIVAAVSLSAGIQIDIR